MTDLSTFCQSLLVDSTPQRKRRLKMAQVVRIGQRWRRRMDHQIVVIRQIHRGTSSRSGNVQVSYNAPPTVRQMWWTVSFADLKRDYELLLSPVDVR
jgi:ribosomal protein L32E